VPGDQVRSLPITQAVGNDSGLATDAPHDVIIWQGRNLYPASLFLAAFD
jgi:hypothetical protein